MLHACFIEPAHPAAIKRIALQKGHLTCPAATLLRGCAFLIETVMTSPMPQLLPLWLMHCAILAPELSVTWSCELLEIIRRGARNDRARALSPFLLNRREENEAFIDSRLTCSSQNKEKKTPELVENHRKTILHAPLSPRPPGPRGPPGLRLFRQRRRPYGQARRSSR